MPLVVPGINSTSGDNAEEWQNKLVGKKLSESESNETVCFYSLTNRFITADELQGLLQAGSSRGDAHH